MKQLKDTVESEIAQGSNYILVCGNTNDGVSAAIEHFKKKYISPGFEDFDFVEYFGDDLIVEDFANRLLSPPMMSEKKVIIIKNSSSISKSNGIEIDRICADIDSMALLIVFSTDENAVSFRETMESGTERFPNAKLIKIYKEERTRSSDLKERLTVYLKGKMMNLEGGMMDRLLEKTDYDLNFAYNIINLAYMKNDGKVIDNFLADESGFDYFLLFTYEIERYFFLKNAEKTVDYYEKCVKWKMMNSDGIVLMLMRKLEDFSKLKKDYETSTNRTEFYKTRLQLYPNIHTKKISEKDESFKKWKYDEITAAYDELYLLLRDLRTYSNDYANLLVQETLLKIILRGRNGI